VKRLILSAAPALAPLAVACGGGEAEESGASLNQLERISVLEPEVDPKAKALEIHLLPLTRADIESQLQPGAGCDISRDGQPLLVAVAEAAIARVNGTVVRLVPGGPVGPSGGFFTGPGVRISVGRADEQGTVAGETRSWPARVSARNPADDAGPTTFDAVWTCGA
jgi:hypothetical protein